MDNNKELVGERLIETFGNDSQACVAKKLHTSQGNVSKWESGKALPSTDNLLLIANTYNVSIDWLLGVSDSKTLIRTPKIDTYEACVKTLLNLTQHGAISELSEKEHQFLVKDPILLRLLPKGLSLRQMDIEFYNKWIESKLSLFSDTAVLYAWTWDQEEINYGLSEAESELELLGVYAKAAKIADEFDKSMADSEPHDGE